MAPEPLTTDTFRLIYEGEDVQGEMDVSDLAPALLAIGEVFKSANSALNGSEMTVATSVKAEFREGSFEILLSVHQQFRDIAAGVLPALHVLGADRLIATVIGSASDRLAEQVRDKAPKVVVGLFRLLGVLRGETPQSIEYDESTRSAIFVLGNNNQIHVDQATAGLYRNGKVRDGVVGVISPMRKSRIRSVKAKKESAEIASLDRTDFPEINIELPVPVDAVASGVGQPNTQEMIVRIVKANFAGDKWSVSDGGKPYEVTMEDAEFKRQVHEREIGFFDGDMYRVRMMTDQKVDGSGLRTLRKVVKVISPFQPPVQNLLPLPDAGGKLPDESE